MTSNPAVEGPEEATPDGDDDPVLCDEDCVSDEEHALEVPELVTEATPAVVQQDT